MMRLILVAAAIALLFPNAALVASAVATAGMMGLAFATIIGLPMAYASFRLARKGIEG